MQSTNGNLGPASRAVTERLEHVNLGVADVDRSVDFYRRALGFEVRHAGGGAHGRFAHVGTDRFYVALTEQPGIAPARRGDHAAVFHFGFTTPDLEAFRARLAREGIAPAEEAHRAEGNAIYLEDPDGHEIEVVGYAHSYVYA
ncbi:MAG: VOC family protein [Planctomycetes bacterium]|nr:VOC family protein [Planctomycetota bacterium]